MDDLYSSAGGGLKLKKDSKVKKKKSKKQSKVISQITNTDDPTLKKVVNRMTKAEMAFEKAREKRGNRMASKLSKDERVSIVFMCGVPGATYRSVAQEFNSRNPHRPPIDQSTVGRLIKRFKETGSVTDQPRSGRPKTVTSPKTLMMVLAQLSRNPKISTRKLSQKTGVSKSSIMRILQKHVYSSVCDQGQSENFEAISEDFNQFMDHDQSETCEKLGLLSTEYVPYRNHIHPETADNQREAISPDSLQIRDDDHLGIAEKLKETNSSKCLQIMENTI